MLALAMLPTARAEPEKPDVPVGYEEAGQAGKQQKRVRRRIVVPAVPQANNEAELVADDKLFAKNPQLEALVEQMRPQLQPIFAAELTFAKDVCQPNDEQFQIMKTQATPELERALRTFALKQAPMMGIQIGARPIRRQRQQASDVFEIFESSANRIVTNVFPQETVAIYQEEQKHRHKFRAESGAMALVAHLDTRFRLSQDQREQLTDSIQEVWQREWQTYLQYLASNPQFFPQVPDDAIVPYLNEVQAKQWSTMQRQTIHLGWQNLNNRQFFRGMKPEIDWFEKQEQKARGLGGVGRFFGVDVQDVVVEIVEEAVLEIIEEEEEDQEE